MDSSPDLRKRAHYDAPQVVESYESRRFGGRAGRYVHERHVGIVMSLLPPNGRILDLPAGTGRLGEELRGRGFDVVLADASQAMLQACGRRRLNPRVQTDIFAPGFGPGTFDAITCMGLACHYPDIGRLLSALRPLVRPHGRVVIDCLNWSVFSWLVLRNLFSGPVYIHCGDRVARAAEDAGFTIVEKRSAFYVSQLLYRWLPLGLVRKLTRWEARSQKARLVKTYYHLTAISPPARAH